MKNICLVFIIIAAITGCRDVQEINTYFDLKNSQTKEIEIVTLDSCVYTTSNFSVNDSSIIIEGMQRKGYVNQKYQGEIPYNRITYIQTGDEEFFGPSIAGGVAVIIIALGSDLIGKSGITTQLIFPSGDGGSCPFLYSWNGHNFVLEGETFGISLGKALESETAVVLQSLKAVNGKVKIKFTNERPETHYFNTIELYAVEKDTGTLIYTDNMNFPKSVRNIKNIISAEDNDRNDISGRLSLEDGNFWRSNMSSANLLSGFEDVINITIDADTSADSVALLLTAKNTDISAVVFEYLYNQLGYDFTSFTRAAEIDPELIKILKDVLERSALKIDIWNGTEWKYAGLIYPEASAASFRKMISLPVIKDNAGKMRIRLRAMTDVWMLDKISTGISADPEVIMPELLSGCSDNSKFLIKDNEYLRLLPGEEITLEYKEVKSDAGKKIVYIAEAGGFLYEYLIRSGNEITAGLDMVNPNFPELGLIKMLLKNEDVFLPMIYNKWMEHNKTN